MVKIRLMRVGKRKQPSYRVVVADSRSPRDGRIIEAIGHYNPRTEPSLVTIDTERADYWLGTGAQASNTVKKLIEIAKGASAPEAKPAVSKKVKATRAASVEEAPETGTEEEIAAPAGDIEGAPAAEEPSE